MLRFMKENRKRIQNTGGEANMTHIMTIHDPSYSLSLTHTQADVLLNADSTDATNKIKAHFGGNMLN